MLKVVKSAHGLKRGTIYTVDTDGDKVVFVTKGRRKKVTVPINLIHELKLVNTDSHLNYGY